MRIWKNRKLTKISRQLTNHARKMNVNASITVSLVILDRDTKVRHATSLRKMFLKFFWELFYPSTVSKKKLSVKKLTKHLIRVQYPFRKIFEDYD